MVNSTNVSGATPAGANDWQVGGAITGVNAVTINTGNSIDITFNAARSNGTYNSNGVLQPKAVSTYILIKM